jgi:hypothetical protein
LIGAGGWGTKTLNREDRSMFRKIAAAAAAIALVASPTVAAAQSAAPVEIAPATETAEGEELRGGFILPLAIIVAIVIAVLLLTKSDEEDTPVSP